MGQHLTAKEKQSKSARDFEDYQHSRRLREARELFLQALSHGADAAHLVWRALRPELIESGTIARDVQLLPAGRPEPYSPPPPPDYPPRPRPALGQELHDLDQAVTFAEELDGIESERQAELLTDIWRRMERLRVRLLARIQD